MTPAEPPAERRRTRPLPPFVVLKDFLEPGLRNDLLAYAIANEERFEPSALFDGRRESAMRVSHMLRDFGPAKDMLRDRFSARLAELGGALRVAPFEPFRLELELVAHGDGAFYKRHLDTRTGERATGRSIRLISAVYYFHAEPKAFSGGALRLHSMDMAGGEGDFVDIEPAQNTLVAFLSWAPHEVLPVSCPSRRFCDARFAVNLWAHRAPLAMTLPDEPA